MVLSHIKNVLPPELHGADLSSLQVLDEDIFICRLLIELSILSIFLLIKLVIFITSSL